MKQKLISFYKGFISGMWFVSIMRQCIITGGNIAESAFLLATLWVIVNAVAHTMVLWVIDAHTIELINNLSAIAFSALPELIIIPVIIVCYGHWHTAIKYKSLASGTWAILYSIPALFFLVMTIITITTFVSTKGTQFVPMDGFQLVIRCLSGWMYAVVNMLFQKLGEPHYASKLDERDTAIAQLKTRIETLTAEYSQEKEMLLTSHSTKIETLIAEYSAEKENLTSLLKTQSVQVKQLSARASSLVRDSLENYPIVLNEWLEKGKKTASISEIEKATGHSKRRINAAIEKGLLVKDPRNKDFIRVSSVIEWLKIAPLPDTLISSNGHSNGHAIESDIDPFGLPIVTIAHS